MKRFLLVLLIGVLALSFAMAENALSNEELFAIINDARNELAVRNAQEEKAIIADSNDCVVYLTNNCSISGGYIKIEAVFVNNTDRSLSIGTDGCVLNGWEAFCWTIGTTSPHSKKKDDFEIKLDDTDVTDVSEIETLTLNLYAFDSEKFEKIPLNIVNVVYDGSAFVVVK